MSEHPSRNGPSRRAVLGGSLGAFALLHPGAAQAQDPPTTSVLTTEVGPAHLVVNVRSVAFGQLPDGRAVVYAISNGSVATFNVIDALSGERIFATELDRAELGGFITICADGTVVFTARSPLAGGLFTFNPHTFEVTLQAEGLEGQSVLYDGTVGDDGKVYFGTYPDARVMSYDPQTTEIRDYGSQVDDAEYVFGLGIVNGEIWAGTGPVPHLFRIDPESGDRVEMEPPSHVMEGTDWFISIEQRHNLVFVRLSPRGTYDMAIYDTRRQRWTEEIIPGTFDAPPTDVGHRHRVYFLQGEDVMAYQIPSQRLESVGFEDSPLKAELAGAVGTYGISLLDHPDLPADTVAGLNTDGALWHYSVATGEHRVVEADLLGSPLGAHSIGVGSDGTVYFGAYLSSGVMSRIDQDTEEIEALNGPKQSDAILAFGDRVAVSSYPGAIIHAGDPVDWEWTEFEQLLELGRGAPNFQDRIFAMVEHDGRIVAGSVPDYGQLGGALTIVDPTSGDYDMHRDVVPEQSIVALALSGDLVVGGTSIHGGLSSNPSRSTAELFTWDLEAEALVTSEAVVDGAHAICELHVGPDGTVWGLASDGTVFAYDVEQGAVSGTISTGKTTSNEWGRRTSLFHRASDGFLYAAAGGALLRLDPVDMTSEILVDSDVSFAALDGHDRIYVAGEVMVRRVGA